MTSLARQHRDRVLAAIGGRVIAASGATAAMLAGEAMSANDAGAPERDPAAPGASVYALHLAQLVTDRLALKGIQSVERKVARKREMLPAYDAWIEGALAAGEAGPAVQDDVLVRVMIWRIDVGDLVGAFPLAAHVLRHGLQLPTDFTRTPATLITELFADGAIEELKAGRPAPFRELADLEDLVRPPRDMPDEVRARLHKALGYELARQSEDADACMRSAGGPRAFKAGTLTHLRRALELNERVGVKTDIARLERELNKEAAPAG